MSNAIVFHSPEGEPVTTTTAIATGTLSLHASVIKLVRSYLSDFEEFGRVRFEIQPFETNGGVQEREVAIINEDQSTLLLSYMRNNDVVRAFKKQLVRSFVDMRQKLRDDPLVNLPPEQRALIALMVDNAAIKAKQVELESKQIAQDDSIKRIEAKQSAIENGASYFTVIGYGVIKGISFSLADAGAMGRSAAKLSKAAGIAIDSVRDPRFGKVNSYHESMLDAALAKLHGGM